MIENPVTLAASIAASTALAFWLETRFPWARKVGAALLAILFGALLSNLKLVPIESPVYVGIFGPVTSLAIVWLLFAVRLTDLRRAGPTMFVAFAIAVVATAVGATLASLVFAAAFPTEAWKLAGVLTGTYSGGSLNFVAVGRSLELSPSLFSAVAAADNVVTAVWIGATLLLPLWLRRYYRASREFLKNSQGIGVTGDSGRMESSEKPTEAFAHPLFSDDRPGVLDVALLLALGFGLLRAADALHGAVPSIPAVLWLTTLALIGAQLRPVQRISGSMQLGYLALHLFFVLIGISSRLEEIFRVGPEVLYLTAAVVGIHGLLVYGVGWLAGMRVETISVASQAAIGGPPTALALAVARGWPELALPGIAAGLMGYALGSYAGFGVAALVRMLLTG